MDNKKSKWYSVLTALFLGMSLCIAAHPVGAQMASLHFQILTSMMNSGGGLGSSSSFEVKNSTGQGMPTGVSRSSHFGLFAGFQAFALEGYVLPTYQRGDVNGDLSIDVLDVITTVNHILGTIPLTGDALICADCNADGEIDVLDCLGIVNVILGIAECEP